MNANSSIQEIGKCIYTIGHSSHPIDTFLELLKKHSVQVLVDIRSHPHSKYAPQFDMESLKAACGNAGVKYVYMGTELGGRPPDKELYDDAGHVMYAKLADSAPFKAGIARLLK